MRSALLAMVMALGGVGLSGGIPSAQAAPREYVLQISGYKTYQRYSGFLEELNNRLASGTLIRERKLTRKLIEVVVRTETPTAELKDDLSTALMVGAQQSQVQIDEKGDGVYAIRMQ